MRIEKILSEFDGLGLEIAVIVPEGIPKALFSFPMVWLNTRRDTTTS